MDKTNFWCPKFDQHQYKNWHQIDQYRGASAQFVPPSSNYEVFIILFLAQLLRMIGFCQWAPLEMVLVFGENLLKMVNLTFFIRFVSKKYGILEVRRTF